MFDLATAKHSKLVSKVLLALGNLKAVTKQLKLQSRKAGTDQKKLVISTNWLDAIGLYEGRLVTETVLGDGQGIAITPAKLGDTEVKKVYGRSYKNRATERETLLQLASQRKLQRALGDAERVHITFSNEQVLIKPIFDAPADEGQGAVFQLDQYGYAGMVEAIEIIKQRRFAEVQFSATAEFDATAAMLFGVQLRRLGYQVVEDNGNYCAKLGKAHSFVPLQPVLSRQPFRFDFKNPKSVMAVCTSGVDVFAMEQENFKTKAILEWRPQEMRDKVDKTELGAINAACASKHATLIINEDIYAFDINNLAAELQRELKTNIFHVSVQCDDFSSLKTHAQRQQAIENLSTTMDMIFPALSLIKRVNPAVVVLENVANFAASTSHEIFNATLKSLGYNVYSEVLNAKDFNGYTNRARCFVVASRLPAPFSMPQKEIRKVHAGDLVNMALQNNWLRDVSHTVSVKKGIETGRIRLLTADKSVAPTLTKSQSRQTKDSCYFYSDGKYYLPNETMQRIMIGFNPEFDFVAGNAEEISEMIGQSVDIPTHSKLMRQVHQHIVNFLRRVKAIVEAKNQQSFELKSA